MNFIEKKNADGGLSELFSSIKWWNKPSVFPSHGLSKWINDPFYRFSDNCEYKFTLTKAFLTLAITFIEHFTGTGIKIENASFCVGPPERQAVSTWQSLSNVYHLPLLYIPDLIRLSRIFQMCDIPWTSSPTLYCYALTKYKIFNKY